MVTRLPVRFGAARRQNGLADRRQAERVPIALAVQGQVRGQRFRLPSVDIGVGGILLGGAGVTAGVAGTITTGDVLAAQT